MSNNVNPAGTPDQDPVPWIMGYSKPFWVANVVELLERAAWYGVFIAITLYLSNVLSFSDGTAGIVAGVFTAGLYLFPMFSGAFADRMGFRKALLLAFTLLTIGYAAMWALPTMLESAGLVKYGGPDIGTVFTGLDTSWHKWLFLPVMFVIMIGGSFIKSVITATVAKETTEATRAKGYSIFYAMVNIGAFGGKTIVKPLRESMGDQGLIVLNLFAASMTVIAFVLIFFFYKNKDTVENTKSISEVWHSLGTVMARGRLVVLTLIITGFWLVQTQLYASMPKYVIRMAGEGAAISWIANVNPLVVFISVGFITHLLAKRTALSSMTIGMFIMPVSAFCMAAGNMLGDGNIMGLHPVAAMMVLGVALQGLGECFISPRYLEYFSFQAPKGEEGLYLGFSHLHSFLSALIGFTSSGFLLQKFCPNPSTLEPQVKIAYDLAMNGQGPMPEQYAHAHYLWFVFVGVAVVSAIALIIYGRVFRDE
jgi:dipeptide/tripeptide permease